SSCAARDSASSTPSAHPTMRCTHCTVFWPQLAPLPCCMRSAFLPLSSAASPAGGAWRGPDAMAVLPRYIARRILGSIVAAAAIIFLVISFSDFVNLITRLRDDSPATFGDLAILSLQRSPAIMEVVFPFAVLFGSIAAFVSLSRRMELVVARASGVSVWQ